MQEVNAIILQEESKRGKQNKWDFCLSKHTLKWMHEKHDEDGKGDEEIVLFYKEMKYYKMSLGAF